jgi:Rrf2 family protein
VRIWVPAKGEYAVKAAVELAAVGGESLRVKARRIAVAQAIPLRFLLNILHDLVVAGLVESHRGTDGGFRLVRPASDVTLGEVLRAVQSEPEASGAGADGESFEAIVQRLRSEMWRSLDDVTLADLVRARRQPVGVGT